MPERAEIEAVARERVVMEVLSEWYGHVGLRCVREVLAALDRVRDARGDDEVERLRAINADA